jgi:hypothetical protein
LLTTLKEAEIPNGDSIELDDGKVSVAEYVTALDQ